MDFRLMLISVVITLVITMPIMLRWINRGAYRKKSEIMIEEATKAGRVAQAILVTKSIRWGDEGNPDTLQRQARWLGTYTYTVNGTSYTTAATLNSTTGDSDRAIQNGLSSGAAANPKASTLSTIPGTKNHS